MIKEFKDWINGVSPGDDSTKVEVTAWKRRAFIGLILGILLGALGVSGCKSEKIKDTLETSNLVQTQKQTIQNISEENKVLKEKVSSYQKEAHKDKKEHVALDGKGDVVRNSKGNPLVLRDSDEGSSEASSLRESSLIENIQNLQLENIELKVEVSKLKKTHVEENDSVAVEVSGIFSATKLNLKPSVGPSLKILTVPFLNVPLRAGLFVTE